MHQKKRNSFNAMYILTLPSGLKPSNTQLNSMLITISMSKNFALDVTFGSFVGEEGSVSIVCQLVIIGDLFHYLC
jgi:hypothetical protein